MGGRGYPPEFRRKVLDLVEAGRPIAEVAKALGNERPVDLHLAPPRPHRQGPPTRPEQPRARRAGGGPPPDHPAGDRAGRHSPGRRAAKAGGAPFRRFPAIQVMATQGSRCRSLPGAGGLPVRLLRLAQPATVGPGDPSRLAHRRHPPHPCRLPPDRHCCIWRPLKSASSTRVPERHRRCQD